MIGTSGTSGPASSARAVAEWGGRLLVLGGLIAALLWSLRARSGIGTPETATSGTLATRLVRWSTVVAPERVHVALDYPPPLAQRDWLAALPGVGTAVRWSGAALVPTAVALEPVADPAGGADLAIAAPAGAQVALRDALGPFDTVTAGPHGVRVYLPQAAPTLQAAVGPVVAQATLRDSLVLKRLLVLGHAGWEAKFVLAALEERGWKADAFLALSPKGHGQGNVRQGTIGTIDTATYAAVLALDTVAAAYAESITRYVRSGGGLLLWAAAAQTPGLAALAAGKNGTLMPDDGKVPDDSTPRRALALVPVTQLRPEALVLERRGDQPALVARRLGPGRVLQVGYVDAWRWRMAGQAAAAPAAYQTWLARLVASVAYTDRRPRPAATADVAPLATLVDRLGPASPAVPPAHGPRRLGPWLFALIAVALLLEWLSRRLRGAA